MQHFYTLVSQVCHCATFLFMCFPGLSLLVSALFRWPCSISIHSPNSLLSGLLNALKNGRLGAGWSGPVPGPACLPLSFVSQFFSFVSQFFSFLSPQAGRLWSGSRLACLPLPFICLPLLFTCLPVLSFVLQARCLWSSGSFVSHFFSFVGGLLVVGFPAGLSPTSFHSRRLCSGSRPACLPLP